MSFLKNPNGLFSVGEEVCSWKVGGEDSELGNLVIRLQLYPIFEYKIRKMMGTVSKPLDLVHNNGRRSPYRISIISPSTTMLERFSECSPLRMICIRRHRQAHHRTTGLVDDLIS